jgi:adenine-specific DNA-methyltransferase
MKYDQKWREGEKIGKVILIKDINVEKTHRAHIDILDDLKVKAKVTDFKSLNEHWLKVLNSSELNKKFYQELSNWYFWALDNVSFPDDIEKNKDVRNATNLIRLITRVIFIWFIKEKDLVPESLFDEEYISKILKEYKKDKSSVYYQAILQNLFFGTLNQKMNERKFAQNGDIAVNKKEYGIKNLYRYQEMFNIPEKDVVKLFEDIPFLNGGLFDCLDKMDGDGVTLYMDGFSRNTRKRAQVQDFLFFSGETEYDLNKIYDTKNKNYTVRGLINILNSYKFTIAENTPIEEEVALDPELLGKVFENLLASYNPETQTTARKQTGSFYTPREIVNYMVDESLKEYLKQNLKDKLSIENEEAEIGLEIIFNYVEKDHAYTDEERKVLINAIDNCKILDPACGSGAFPMGVLHKLVYILNKLDPGNELWKDRQIEKVNVDDPNLKEKLVADVERSHS